MKNILEVKDLATYFFTDKGTVKAVDGVSYTMREGQTLGIVGESGCGKSINAMSILNLIERPGKIVSGSIKFNGEELVGVDPAKMRHYRGNEISMIFQEPMTSLNPVFRIRDQISESLMLHQNMKKEEAYEKSVELLKLVGIPRAEKVATDYPHQLSGGMRQRVMIAMALACDPKILIADEPTTALDVTIQAQILSLMNDLQRETNTAIMLITHDLGVVAQMAHHVLVMYSGKVVESAPVVELFKNPKHPYTQGLLASIPDLKEEKSRLNSIDGVVPNPFELPEGCYFAPRCKHAMDICLKKQPSTYDINSEHTASCFLYSKEGGDM
ncbi:peptide/nickel transport system ATP-binding protein [Proteiniborus ethanoligenes]|uniref:Peptide/nickel transport system ATP-binding protein n=1 Tax=Proteiniborus ethanoligenes TaxID=415015 RepID=A0A1H3MNI6_9FIRM|nr:ABC transporter ATP-binding protein [Proteiniborus ethanoligenes]SDY77659.1 peptide/nickel transport system ATP-binding protein [Proteiniborus ethanoligenes]